MQERWVYLATNLLVDKNVEDALKLLERAAKAGYNGVALADSKFMRWDQLPLRDLATSAGVHQRSTAVPIPRGWRRQPGRCIMVPRRAPDRIWGQGRQPSNPSSFF